MKKSSKNLRFAVLFGLAVFCISSTGLGLGVAEDADTSPPYVVSSYPAPGQGGVPTNARIHATFSEEMDPGSITSSTFTLRTALGSEAAPGLVSYGNRSATLILFEHLVEMTSYTATISGNVRDLFGNSLGRDYSWSFAAGSQ